MNTKHIIKNYDQVKLRLEQLSKDFNTRSCDYYFAVGDLFNQNIPKGATRGRSNIGLNREVQQLLDETGTEISTNRLRNIRWTARAWPKDERTCDVAFTVYNLLVNYKDLIRDGMTPSQAQLAMHETNGTPITEELRRRAKGRKTFASYNRTQRLVITVNQLRGQLKALDDDDGTPLTPEEIERIDEAYAILDAYCERKGVSMRDEEAVAA